ncbi:MAG TPA: hypothetical protein DCZ72_06085 [Armatimonadetes bacterium]|nr:hypothetical protein [Armatimonadota bacterium]
MRQRRWLFALLGGALVLGLAGCGAAIRWDSGNPGAANAGYARPISGRYTGRLRGDQAEGTISLRMVTSTTATASVLLDGERYTLRGTMLSSSRLRLTGAGLLIDGAFRGAYHPQDSSYYEPRGVEFRGTWESTNAGQGEGTVFAWHDAWPPQLSYYDSWYNDYYWWGGTGTNTGGGTTLPPTSDTGGSTGGSTGGTTAPPSGGGGSGPIDGSGDTTNGGIIWREQE